MFRLDNNFLIELGLGSLPPEEKNKMLAHIYETLEMRVGMKLAEQMTDAQLNEFESFIDRNDEAGALTWLETNFPNYKQVVADELEKLKAEVKQIAPQILASAGAQPSGQPAPPPPAQFSQPPAQPQQQQPSAQPYSQPPAPQPPTQPQQPSNPTPPQQQPQNPGVQNPYLNPNDNPQPPAQPVA